MDLSKATPTSFISGHVDNGLDLGPVSTHSPGLKQVILGIDVYAGLQPNNGFFQYFALGAANEVIYTIFSIQQSQNFPGPFHWRGFFYLDTGVASLQAHASVPFDFISWGFFIPDFTLDSPGNE